MTIDVKYVIYAVVRSYRSSLTLFISQTDFKTIRVSSLRKYSSWFSISRHWRTSVFKAKSIPLRIHWYFRRASVQCLVIESNFFLLWPVVWMLRWLTREAFSRRFSFLLVSKTFHFKIWIQPALSEVQSSEIYVWEDFFWSWNLFRLFNPLWEKKMSSEQGGNPLRKFKLVFLGEQSGQSICRRFFFLSSRKFLWF